MQKLIFRNGNGVEINLTSGNYGITEWEGFSADSLNIQSQQVPFQDGGVFLDALMEQRELSVTLAIQDNNDLETRYRLRRELISVLNPKLGEGLLIYTNDFISKQIHVIPQLPIFQNKNSNDAGTPKASLSWTACNPYWEDLHEKVVDFKAGEIPTIKNEGDAPAQMEIEFLTGSAVNPAIRRMSDNQKIEYKGTLGKNLYINTNIGKKEVYSEDILFNIALFNGNINGICYSSRLGLYVGVSSGVIYSSYDAINWTSRSSGVSTSLRAVCYSAELNMFVVVGNAGTILTSPDGVTWTSRSSGVSTYLNGVCYSTELNMFVVVGDNGTILTSPDGVTWTSRSSGVSTSLRAVCYSTEQNQFVAVGSGTILYTTFTPADNQIQNITLDSDMGLNLLLGNNSFRLTRDRGELMARIKYRQKYIGV